MPDKAYRILLIDDEPRVADIAARFLGKNGFSTETAIGGEKGMACLTGGEEFDLLIIDMRMPGVNGIDVIRKMGELQIKLPILILTGSIDTYHNLPELKTAGVTGSDILCKPVNLGRLLDKVKTKLGICPPVV